MNAVVTCPRCGSSLTAPPGVAAGTAVRCPEPWCRDVFPLGGRDRPRRAAAACTPPARPAAGRVMLAAPFGVASLRPFPGAESLGRVRLQPGCFTRSLELQAAIALLDDHDTARPVCPLTAWQEADGLYVDIPVGVESPRGRPALSPSFVPFVTRPGRDRFGPLTDESKAGLAEVAFVAAGNFPGTGDPVAAARRSAAHTLRRPARCT